MKKLLFVEISENEKQRILEMHKKQKNKLISEELTPKQIEASNAGWGPVTDEYAKTLPVDAQGKIIPKQTAPQTSSKTQPTKTTTTSKSTTPSTTSSKDPVGYAKSLKWAPGETIQKGVRNNNKVRAIQALMSLVGSKGQKLVTGYFGPITDGGLVNNYSDVYKSGQPIDQNLFNTLVDRLAQNITYAKKDEGGELVKGGDRPDIPGGQQNYKPSNLQGWTVQKDESGLKDPNLKGKPIGSVDEKDYDYILTSGNKTYACKKTGGCYVNNGTEIKNYPTEPKIAMPFVGLS